MIGQSYITLVLPGQFGPGNTGGLHFTASKVMSTLHGAFSALSDRGGFAIDLPNAGSAKALNTIRIFAKDAKLLAQFILLTKDNLERFGVTTSPDIITVPASFEGPWALCKRYRIPSRKSFSKSMATVDARATRMNDAMERQLAHFSVRSRSNGNGFRIYVDRVVLSHNEALALSEKMPQWCADKYGLSNTEKVALVPSL